MSIDPAANASFAEAIDRLMTVDIPGRGFVPLAYTLARRLVGAPTIQKAGDALLESMSARETPTVLIVTGATSQRVGLPDWVGEMDGPPGAIALARAVALTHHAVPVLLTDPGQGHMLSAAAQSLGFYTLPYKDVLRQAEATTHASSVAVIEIPDTVAAARAQAEEFVNELNPCAAIAIEKAGENEHGVYHNSQKVDTSPGKARADEIFKACKAAGRLTIGIGDGGNEIGMGAIKKELLEAFPHMARCNCSCHGSILAEQALDHLLVATVSNWGAYALTAYLAFMTGQPYACHSPDRERRLLEGCARAGYMHLDGFSTSGADGLPVEVHMAFVRLLSTMVFWPALTPGRAGLLRDMMPA